MRLKKNIIIIFIIILLLLFITIFSMHYDAFGKQVPVLLYHHFLTEEELKKYDNSSEYVVSVETFDKQLQYLYDNGYDSITLDELNCWKNNKCNIPEKSFVIVIDDGLISTFRYAKPILEKYGYTATLFTISSRINYNIEDWDYTKLQYVTSDIVESNDNIIDIQSHSHDMHHMISNDKAIETMNCDEINNDLKESKKILNSQYLAYPFNTFNKCVFEALENNDYLLAFRGTNKKTYKNEYKYMTSRIFINNDMEYFKSIFETDSFDQSLKDKILSDLVWLKKEVIK